jgi:hypothetical protein
MDTSLADKKRTTKCSGCPHYLKSHRESAEHPDGPSPKRQPDRCREPGCDCKQFISLAEIARAEAAANAGQTGESPGKS